MDDKNILVIDLTKNIGKTLMSSNGFTVDSLTVNRSSKTHYHKCYELELLLSGSAKIQINNVFYNATKGNFWLSKPNDIHRLILNDDKCTLINFKFEESILPKILYNRLNSMQHGFFGYFDTYKLADFENLFSLLNKKYNSLVSDLDKSIFSKNAIKMLITYFCTENSGESTEWNIRNSKDERFFDAIFYVKNNFKSQLSLKELSQRFGYTPNYLSSKFKKITGRSFIEFLNNEKLRFAYFALCTTDISITDIAEQLGFESASYFSKQFKKHYNIAPSKIEKIVE